MPSDFDKVEFSPHKWYHSIIKPPVRGIWRSVHDIRMRSAFNL